MSVDDFSLSPPDRWGERERERVGAGLLNDARKVKNDEFYTRYEDIEKEVEHYPGAFKDKIVYCNCDQEWSAFPRFFNDHRKELGLRGVLRHPGPFGGKESIAMLKTADIVATNPPFSHFRAFVSQIMEYSKGCLIVGNVMSATYPQVFALMQSGYLSIGHERIDEFYVPDSFDGAVSREEQGRKVARAGAVWYTTMPNHREHLDLMCEYSPTRYPRYDDQNAIEVSKVRDIPIKYAGVMGVPISFWTKHHRGQFDVIGVGNFHLAGKSMPRRLLIRHKHPVGD